MEKKWRQPTEEEAHLPSVGDPTQLRSRRDRISTVQLRKVAIPRRRRRTACVRWYSSRSSACTPFYCCTYCVSYTPPRP
jgi:hypothetical protein|eukprot:COSAG02_NODE_3940_length_6009_cov_3.580880_3_plen_79_part_00